MRERRHPPARIRTESVDSPSGSDTAEGHEIEARAHLIDTDEAAASEARLRYKTHGIEPIEPDDSIRCLLMPGEQLLATRRGVALDRRAQAAFAGPPGSVWGDLYVTSARLIHIGGAVVSFDLDDIEDAPMADDRLLLLLADGVGLSLDADRPRLLRVQIAAARAARASSGSRSSDRSHPASR
jgi:hypothetical protein